MIRSSIRINWSGSGFGTGTVFKAAFILVLAELIRLSRGEFLSTHVRHGNRFIVLVTGEARGARVKHGLAVHQETVAIAALE